MLRVPVGTQVLDDEGELVADLAHPGRASSSREGGSGGRGNKRFAGADAADAALRRGRPARARRARSSSA